MSLERTESTVWLKADDGLYYAVALVDNGGGAVGPEGDETTGAAGTSDAYVALLGDDANVYRWSLEKQGGLVGHALLLSPDQAEASAAGVDLFFADAWYRVSVEMAPDALGAMIPTLVTGDGEPWTPFDSDGAPLELLFVRNSLELEFI